MAALKKSKIYLRLFIASTATALLFSSLTLVFGLNSVFPLAALFAVLAIAAFYSIAVFYHKAARYRAIYRIITALKCGGKTAYDVYAETGIKASAVKELFSLAKERELTDGAELQED